MPCRVDLCPICEDYNCPGFLGGNCINGKKPPKTESVNISIKPSFDTSGALCDLLSLLEYRHPNVFLEVDPATIHWWKEHEQGEKDKTKKEALSKLSPREKQVLNLERSDDVSAGHHGAYPLHSKV